MEIINLAQIKNYVAIGEQIAVCKKTRKGFVDYTNKSGALTKHLVLQSLIPSTMSYKDRKSLDMSRFFEYVNTSSIISGDKSVTCRICSKTFKTNRDGSLTKHIKKDHEISIESYLSSYKEESTLFKTYITNQGTNKLLKCEECGKGVESTNGLSKHIKKAHNLDYAEYLLKHSYKGKPPVCKCGCNQELLWNQNHYRNLETPYFADYKAGHNPQNGKSAFEEEVTTYLESLGIKQIVIRDRTVLDGKEVDIYLPDYKIAIECNGCYWHSENQGKGRQYHFKKKELALAKGIELIHIWDIDWYNKTEIWQDILRTMLKKNTERIFARKCEIRNVPSKEYRGFAEKYHLQGYAPSFTTLGLYYKGTLCMILSLSKGRVVTGSKVEKEVYEVLRVISKKGCTVVGGLSKLFKHFIKIYNPSTIYSYVDYDWSSGHSYKVLNMKSIQKTGPGYFYVKGTTKYHRWQFTKKRLIEQGYDINSTEKEIMVSRGFLKVWTCGNLKYEWRKEPAL